MEGSEVVERMSFQQFKSIFNYIQNYMQVPKPLKEAEIIHEEQLRYFYAAALEYGNESTARFIEKKYMSDEEPMEPFTINGNTCLKILTDFTNVEKMPLNLIKFYHEHLDEIIWSY